MLTIYGIKNCNTMKKAFGFLEQNDINYQFFDYKKQVLDFDVFNQFVQHFGIDKVINKQGVTYKKLSDEDKTIIKNGDVSVIYELVKSNQSMLKRPIVVGKFGQNEVQLMGFVEADWQHMFIG